ncbi:parallel beta-helix domain-containing protein [Pseudoteredinibacter isoporae]|uniref:Parallel beta-helix repeat protein n=1 Tax=Pseudoteredinibacter isoporae TaxID=570281 RepID=A0A7X0JW88_9GAMM|nr:parallel beta-helix domain-containing protein [Pseudoteredinibacter isoporae]MBB6522878.1 parallel beta-helix repeat protein [Pseudoteredinibacter isoporae]NHO88404.1 cytochrome-c peroxidase [Pseudoteredinibacter isoporae]NIB23265.1 cytochrome-c peroxidase [Pseudoteredinibacter isoporae]
MNKSLLLAAITLAVGFGLGQYLAKDNAPVIKANKPDKSFAGGYEAKQDDTLKSNADVVLPGSGDTITVNPGQKIQDAVIAAKPGDTIMVMPGKYEETIYIDKDSIRLIGVIQEGQRAELNGRGELNDAILYSGNNITVENFLITKYKGNGIMGQAGNNFEIRGNVIVDTGVYGIFPQLGKNGIVSHNIISGIEDAAIYVGMSDNIHVAHNEVFDSVAGIEIENSRHSIVENNYVHNNTGGILAFITPGLPIKTTYDVIIRNNFVVGNNHKNFGAPGSTVAGIPPGTGILVMAADEVVIENNIITDNKTAGIMITDHYNAPNTTIDEGSDPYPDQVAILDNLMLRNGYDTIDEVKALMLTELKTGNPDIVRAGKSNDSCIYNRHRYITVGINDFKDCEFNNTKDVVTYLLDEPVPPREITAENKGKIAYLGICTGCHSYTGRIVGPPVQLIQALYMENPQGLADYIANPVKKRDDYPEMPPQNYLDEETRLAVAEYMLSRTN